ncbi:hypothetical protein CYY_007620 [Polysphondylium violaceum]|uniref:NAD(P)-binding protein n=1 Tax=Polysphondylium violaceum TaxID=133409 RepID=A0A8J4PWZ8_9MYCE|nr:hypothetical protein CYY_007620 [Polysphondylium violaceum]
MPLLTSTKDIDYEKYDLSDKVVIITGSNAGLGKEIAKKIAKLNAHIIFACRNENKAKEAIKEIKELTNNTNDKLEFIKLDLLSLESVKSFVQEFKSKQLKCDILINNAGIMWLWEDLKWQPPLTTISSGQVINTQFLANYLGHFLLSLLMLDNICESPAGRIINVSSCVHQYSSFKLSNLTENNSYTFATYCQSKMAQILSTYKMKDYIADKYTSALDGSNRLPTVNALHPGIFASEIVNLPFPLKNLYHTVFKSAEYCARSIVKVAIDKEYQDVNGKYYDDSKIIKSSSQSYDAKLMDDLWNQSLELVKDYLE